MLLSVTRRICHHRPSTSGLSQLAPIYNTVRFSYVPSVSRNFSAQAGDKQKLGLVRLEQLRRSSSTALRERNKVEAGNELPDSYQEPDRGLLAYLPSSLIPYAELVRLDKPTGAYYLYFPCLFSTLLAAPLTQPFAAPTDVMFTSALFLAGALVMRGAGCTINDLWDRNLDPHVARTRFRPLARRAISPQKAIIFTGVQLLAGLGILTQFPSQCFFYAVPSLFFVAGYPLAKRVTHYPQLVLGLTFSWGALMGFPALEVDLLTNPAALAAACSLYASCVAWTVNYDMIYAHMDIKDDIKAGIKSMVLAHGHRTKTILTGLSMAQIGLLATAGYLAGAGPLFFLGSVGGASVSLAAMVKFVRLNNVQNCWWWFKYGCWFTGVSVSAGLFGDYFMRRRQIITE